MIFLSPTEHELRAYLLRADIAHQNSYLCETNGVDCIVFTHSGPIGYQRKTLRDLFASLTDGRLSREVGQIRSSQLLARACFIIEHDARRTTTDGSSYLDAPFTKTQLRHLVIKLELVGIVVFETSSIADTADALVSTSQYMASRRAHDFSRPKPPTDTWGRRGSRDWGIHVLQSFSNIGPKTAALIYDTFGIPLAWTVSISDLTSLPGVGKVTAERLLTALGPPRSE